VTRPLRRWRREGRRSNRDPSRHNPGSLELDALGDLVRHVVGTKEQIGDGDDEVVSALGVLPTKC